MSDTLHPNGRCICGGEGFCNWCLRARVAELEARCATAEAQLSDAIESHQRERASLVESRDEARARVAELERQRFSDDELRRIANRAARKPRNGQDIRIEAKCRAALSGGKGA